MSLVKRNTGILAGQEPANPIGKTLLIGGAGALPVWLLATLLPGGFLLWAVIMMAVGIFII